MKNGETHREGLEEVLSRIWRLLARGVSNTNDPMHCPSLATGSSQGGQVRTVILRGADEKERTLICFSDSRAAKVDEVRVYGRAQWLFYHPRKQVQMRISGPMTVHIDDRLADVHWERVKGFSRLNYCAEHPPGTPLPQPSSGLPARLLRQFSNLMHTDSGRSNFAVLIGKVDVIDWLQLSRKGNARACFRWEDGRMRATWVVP